MANAISESLGKSNGPMQEFKGKPQGSEANLEKLVHTAGERFGKATHDIAESTSKAVRTSREYVQENPGKGVAIAAAAGVVAGSLLTLALRRSH